MNVKPTTKFNKIINKLGKNYSKKIIDMELCGYRKLNNNYDIEISGINTNSSKNDFTVYLWKLKPNPTISKSYPDIKSVDQLIQILNQIEDEYLD